MKIEVVTSGMEGCFHCEQAKKRVRDLLQDFPELEFGEIDSLEESERIQELGMVTSGAIVIDNKLEFSSLPKEKKLREKVEKTLRERAES